MQYERVVDSTRDTVAYREVDTTSADLGFKLIDIVNVLRKRKWIVGGSIVGALLAGLVVTLLMTPMYTAVTTLEIQRETRNFTNVEGADPTSLAANDPEFYETQAGLLRSRSLAERVALDNRLQDSAVFFEMFKPSRATEWFRDGRLIKGASTRDERLQETANILLDNQSASIERLSRLAEISFTSPDAAFSRRIADSWGKLFIQVTLDRRYAQTSYARNFLEDRLGQLRTRIDEAERNLVSYAASQSIVTLPAENVSGADASPGAERSLVAEDLVALNNALAEATAERIEAQSRLGALGGDVEEALTNQGISQMRASLASLSSQYAEMLERFEPEYPPARALKAQIDSLRSSIGREEGRVRTTLNRTFDAARQREAALSQRVDQLKADLFDLRRRSTQYNILQREVDTNRQLYDALLQRYKEIGVAGGVGVNNISVVDPAEMPDSPSSPKLVINLALALLAGAAIGVALAFALEQFEDTLGDPSEVPEKLGVPLIGVVPKVDEAPVPTLFDPKSVLSEAYFSVGTSLALATANGFPQTLVVTSSRAREGKSLTSLALAKTLAVSGRKVLLVDADMRSPSVHGLLDRARSPGLSSILTGATAPTEAIQPTSIENLSIIAAGPQPPSFADLLSGHHLRDLLTTLLHSFDHVIVDAPPVMGFADAPLIANEVVGTCFVIEAHGTSKSAARSAIARLKGSSSLMCGAIVTKFDVKRAYYGYGYDYGYGYGYGETAHANAEKG